MTSQLLLETGSIYNGQGHFVVVGALHLVAAFAVALALPPRRHGRLSSLLGLVCGTCRLGPW